MNWPAPLDRLASQVLEAAADSRQLVLVGIPTRGVALAGVGAIAWKASVAIRWIRGSLDPTFHRDDLERVGTRLVQATNLPADLSDRHVVLVDDVIFTGTHSAGRPGGPAGLGASAAGEFAGDGGSRPPRVADPAGFLRPGCAHQPPGEHSGVPAGHRPEECVALVRP
jgi:hypothetical protein